MSRTQMEKDIDLWAADKLCQFVDDLTMRYKLINKSRREAEASAAGILMILLAGMLALRTNATVQDITVHFAQLVVNARQKAGQDINLMNEGEEG